MGTLLGDDQRLEPCGRGLRGGLGRTATYLFAYLEQLPPQPHQQGIDGLQVPLAGGC